MGDLHGLSLRNEARGMEEQENKRSGSVNINQKNTEENITGLFGVPLYSTRPIAELAVCW